MYGEYGLILGPSGKGKTTALINIGYAGAGLMGCVNILHVTLEIPVSAVLKRYAARTTGIRLRRDEEFISGRFDYEKMLLDKANLVLKGRVRVVKPGHTIDDIKRTVDELRGIGFDTGLLIVDYADLLHPIRKRTDPRFEIAEITRGLRDLGEAEGFPTWSASQVGRQAFNKEIIDTKDIAESIEKVNASDVVVALCQTEDEEDMGRGRLYLAKVRDAKDRGSYPIKIDKEKQLVVITHE
jgi:KaiC/GvpD/RAD55 family RecA-like ATPase